MAMANLASAGTLIDLTTLDHLNFSQPWWSESLLTQSTVNGKLYFASGDISSSMLYMMCATFYNKKILTEFSLEDPARLALDGKWTIDKMIAMSMNVGADRNGDGKRGFENRPTWASIYAESAPKLEAKLSELTGKFAAGEG